MKKEPCVSLPFMLLGMLFCVCLIAANLLETKQVTLGPLELTAGLIVFPVSYIINDCLVEVWGYRKTRLVIWAGFLMNFLFVLFGVAADALPAAPYWKGEEGFHALFGLAPRIAAASFLAFLAGSFLNAYVMSRMKIRDGGRRFSLRAIASTVAGETADSVIFFPLALGGVVPWSVMPAIMLTQVMLKTLYEILALPVTVRVVRYMKRTEGTDTFDSNIRYNIFKIKDL
ncbi:MAG TPA: queuosine precursor transporter [Alloprevotella sp.]|nr:queuosine precursor transporter [Alloprevotella sp.]